MKLSAKYKKLADDLFRIGCIKFGKYKFKLHKKFPKAPLAIMYVDLRVLRRYPKEKKHALSVYEQLLKGVRFDLIADVPTAGTPFASSLSDRLNVGMITPRIDKKTHGSGAHVDGMRKDDREKTAVLIDDLITNAGSKVEAIKILRHQGIKVKDVVVLLDREQGGVREMKKRRIKIHYALTLSSMMNYYLESGKVDQVLYKRVMKNIKEMNSFIGAK